MKRMRQAELSQRGASSAPAAPHASRLASPAFTLIELILVMTVLTIAVSFTAPALSNFFRGRTLDSEARRFLALTRLGQSRAVSEGIPVELWIDSNQGTFGLEAEPSYDPVDPKSLDVTLDSDIQITVENIGLSMGGGLGGGFSLGSSSGGLLSAPAVQSRHAGLPRIRFLPDGTLSDISPLMVRLTGRDGGSLWVAQSQNRVTYEIRRNN